MDDWKDQLQERERKIAQLKEKHANQVNPLSQLAGEFARFCGMAGVVLMLMLAIYFAGPEASHIINGWLK